MLEDKLLQNWASGIIQPATALTDALLAASRYFHAATAQIAML